MSNVQQVAAKVRRELQQTVPNGVARKVAICDNLALRHYADGRYNIEACKAVKGRRFYESVKGGTVRNIDVMVAAGLETRKRVLRQAEAYRQKTQPTPAHTHPTPAKDTIGRMNSHDLARLLAIGISALAGGMIGWIIGGAL